MEKDTKAWHRSVYAGLYFLKGGRKMNSMRMKKLLVNMMGLVLALTFFSSIGYGEVPQKMNYQGYLTDPGGTPIHGMVSMVFSIYDVSTGGTALWSETQTVVVNQGVYSVNLGDVTTISLTFDKAYYLGVRVGTDPEEMTPRRELTSVGYAFRAQMVETIGGHTHSGSDITSGTVAEAWIDPLIARDSEVTASISTHTANPSAHHTRYTDAEAVAAIKAADGSGSGLDADLLDGYHASAFASSSHNHNTLYYTKAEVDSLISNLQAQITVLQNLLQGLTRSGNDFVITNANLYIQSGSGSTNGGINGKGNLIIGYNELRGGGDDRTGSHNLIVGRRHNYSSYGGIVVGYYNTISAPYSSVSGGYHNTASGYYSSVSGGLCNHASGESSSVSGGDLNTASHITSSVSGGYYNTASGYCSSVSGGHANTASGNYSSVSGGNDRSASGSSDWRAGLLWQDE